MKKEINTLFALLRCAVFDEEPDEQAKKDAADKAELLYEMARHHDLAHIVYYAYKKCSVKIADEAAEYSFLKQQAMSVLRYENLNLSLVSVAELFENEKIPFIPLKGAVIRQLYPEPWMRTSCDVDILVHEQDLERAVHVLVEKLGYRTDGNKTYHDISLYSDTDVHLELHFNIKENMEKVDRLLDRVWDYASPKNENSFEYVLTNEFLLFQHIAHMSYHVVNGGCSVRYFLDLILLENRLDVDKAFFCKMIKEYGLEKFYRVSLKLARIWFSDDKHDEITVSYQRYLLNGGTYGTKMNALAANSDKKGTFSYALSRIFMPYEKLCITYPSLTGKKILLPFYQVRRWMRITRNRRYENASNELKANNSISTNSVNEYSMLIENLDLK